MAAAACPPPRPVKPSFSLVVALTAGAEVKSLQADLDERNGGARPNVSSVWRHSPVAARGQKPEEHAPAEHP